jgi:hypothetical protein
MKRSLAIVLLGVALGGASYGFLVGKQAAAIRELERTCGPELAWIKTEFQLDDTAFERVRSLHEAYKPVCAELCSRIDAQHQRLTQLMESAEGVTPEITQVVTLANNLRARCQTEMLSHFFEVSKAMPPEQGQRYLAWMHDQTLAPSHASMVPQVGGAPNHDQHVH